jgi:site-specific recombinase XerD
MENRLEATTIASAMQSYLISVATARSRNTARTYKNALRAFSTCLQAHHLPVDKIKIQDLEEGGIAWFAASLKDLSPATERLYLAAAAGFYEYLVAECLSLDLNLPRVRLLIHQRSRRQGQRLPQFPREAIEQVLDYAQNLISKPTDSELFHIINLRDRAFLITLADTGLRVHEACNLRRGEIDWTEGRAVIIGKGDKQAVVRFSSRSQKALRDYLEARARLDGASGRPLPSLPLFARHDDGAGKKIKPITTTTGRNIVAQRVVEALGPQAAGSITPHSFRHYFVTTVLLGTGSLKIAQELARHSSIAVTERYAHLANEELDKGYREVFEN